MSRSNPTPNNPAEKHFRYQGSTGILQWYDRDEKKMQDVTIPFRFLVLDELSTIGGFSDSHKSGIWANEVRSTKDLLNVRTSAGQLAIGSYDVIKDALKAAGGKYARSVYIAYQEVTETSSDWKVGNIKMTGAALGAWFDFKRKNNVEEGAIELTGSTTDKTGSVTYHIPTFEAVPVDDDADAIATRLDKALQAYLNLTVEARAKNPVAEPIDVSEAHEGDATPPSEERTDIDLSEIPF